MAFYDDKKFLLSHIRHSFITCDDSGMCEATMLNDKMSFDYARDERQTRRRQERHLRSTTPTNEAHKSGTIAETCCSDSDEERNDDPQYWKNIELDYRSELDDIPPSYDIVPDMDMMGSHRRRSNTAQRLDKLKRDREKQPKIKNIPWRDATVPGNNGQAVHVVATCDANEDPKICGPLLSREQIAQLFPERAPPQPSSGSSSRNNSGNTQAAPQPVKARSALSFIMSQMPPTRRNPYSDYAKFDGRSASERETRKLRIFLAIPPAEAPYRSHPMKVMTLTIARVCDMIGLICWQYTCEAHEPALTGSVTDYALHMAEDNGEIDDDFPSLNPLEPIIKFGFPTLAMVYSPKITSKGAPLSETAEHSESKPSDTVDGEASHRPLLMKKSVTMIEPTTSKDAGNDPNEAVWTHCNQNLMEKKSPTNTEGATGVTSGISASMSVDTLLFETFDVVAVNRLGRHAEVRLALGCRKMEVVPVAPRSAVDRLIAWTPKALNLAMDSVVACDMLWAKQTKGHLKIVYHAGEGEDEFKSLHFECPLPEAQHIVHKMSCIMELRASQSTITAGHQALYRRQKDAKLTKRFSSSHLSSN